MYSIIKSAIAAGGYKLAEMQSRIKRLYVHGDLTESQLDELLILAQGGASREAERPELLQMVRSLSDRVDALAAELAELKAGNGSAEPDTEAATYEPWTAWDGISDKYQPGAIVSHNGKTWISTYSAQNVWEPGVVGDQFWAEHQE